MSRKLTATDRMARLLAVIPWVAARDGVAIDEIVNRFAYPRDSLLDDLRGVVLYVGVYPYTPESLIEVEVENETVWINYADWFERPMRLEPEEALALLAAGRAVAALGIDEMGPLERGLTKLQAAIGPGVADTVSIRLGVASEEAVEVIRSAIERGRVVEFDYYSYARGARQHRVVEPERFFADDGHWYLSGHCRTAEGPRVFRVDRMSDIAVHPDSFEAREEPEAQLFDGQTSLPVVELEIGPDARWVLGQYPTRSVTETGPERWRVELPVTGVAWLERLLLRLGPRVRVVRADPPYDATDLCSAAAARVLERYR